MTRTGIGMGVAIVFLRRPKMPVVRSVHVVASSFTFVRGRTTRHAVWFNAFREGDLLAIVTPRGWP